MTYIHEISKNLTKTVGKIFMVKGSKEILQLERKAIDNLEKPELMELIYKELSKFHIGNKRKLLLTFIVMTSSRLKPDYRVSMSTRGQASMGKSNMVKACKVFFPDNWYADGTRFTRATIEDDIKPYPLLIMGEKPKDEVVTETVKQVSEDGLKIWKKEMDEKKKGKLRDNTFIPRKAVIYTSTESESNEELATRFLINNVESDKKRFENVIESITKASSRPEEAEKRDVNNAKNSWLYNALQRLDVKKNKFDHILIPYGELIQFKTDNAVMQRDSKRFINLIRTMAWIHQKNRIQLDWKGKKILLASIEDMVWAYYVSKYAFIESRSGVNSELEEILAIIKKNVNKKGLTKYDITGNLLDEKKFKYLNRAVIQQELKVSTNTMKRYIKTLKNLNLIETCSRGNHNPVYIRQTYLLGCQTGCQRLSIGCQFSFLKCYERQIYTLYIDNLLTTNSQPFDNPLTTQNKTSTPSNIELVVNNSQNTQTFNDFNTLISVLKAELTTQIDNPTTSTGEKGKKGVKKTKKCIVG